jgi:hypothetical protein
LFAKRGILFIWFFQYRIILYGPGWPQICNPPVILFLPFFLAVLSTELKTSHIW